MINTIAECNQELKRINSELARLNLERNHVLAVRELLGLERSSDLPSSTIKDQILQVVADEPGLNGAQVRERLPEVYVSRQVTHCLADLRKKGIIENRGGVSRSSRWYSKGQ